MTERGTGETVIAPNHPAAAHYLGELMA